MGSGTSASSLAGDFLTPPASADVAADITKYTTKVSPIFTHLYILYTYTYILVCKFIIWIELRWFLSS